MCPIRMSKLETAIRTVLELNAAFNRRDLPAMLALMSEDCVFESAQSARLAGRQSIAAFWEDFFARTPSAKIEIEEIFSLGERCVMRWRFTIGAAEPVRGVDLFRVPGGLISEILSYEKR